MQTVRCTYHVREFDTINGIEYKRYEIFSMKPPENLRLQNYQMPEERLGEMPDIDIVSRTNRRIAAHEAKQRRRQLARKMKKP